MTENAFGVVLSGLVKTIHVELPHKAIHLIMPEVVWKDNFLELVHILNNEVFSRGAPMNDLRVLIILNKITSTLRI